MSMVMNFCISLLMRAGGTSSPQMGGSRALVIIFSEVQQIWSTLSSALMRANSMRALNRLRVLPWSQRSGSLSWENLRTASTAAALCRQFSECADIQILAPSTSRYSSCSYLRSSSGSAMYSPPNSLRRGRMYFSMSASPWLQTQGFLNLQSSSGSVLFLRLFSTTGFFSSFSSSIWSSWFCCAHHCYSCCSRSSNSWLSSCSLWRASCSLLALSCSSFCLSSRRRSVRSWSYLLSQSCMAIICSKRVVSYFQSKLSLSCARMRIQSWQSLSFSNCALALMYLSQFCSCLIFCPTFSTVLISFCSICSLSFSPRLVHSLCTLLMSWRVTRVSSSTSQCCCWLKPYPISTSYTLCSFCEWKSWSQWYLKQGWPQMRRRSMEAGLPCCLSSTASLMYLHLPATSTLTASLRSQTLAREVKSWLSSETNTSSMRMYLFFLGLRQSSVTKVSASSLKRMSMGGTANSVDSHPIMLRVGLWNTCVIASEQLEADTSSYCTSLILFIFKQPSELTLRCNCALLTARLT